MEMENGYKSLQNNASVLVPIATIILLIIYGLSKICHWIIVCNLVNLLMGTSLVFIIYVVFAILFLDRTEIKNILKDTGWDKVLVLVWRIALIILGIIAIINTNRYRNQYDFECSTFLIEKKRPIYHLITNNGCEYKSKNTEEIKGYQLMEEKYRRYHLCEWCEEWLEDACETYDVDRYFRK